MVRPPTTENYVMNLRPNTTFGARARYIGPFTIDRYPTYKMVRVSGFFTHRWRSLSPQRDAGRWGIPFAWNARKGNRGFRRFSGILGFLGELGSFQKKTKIIKNN